MSGTRSSHGDSTCTQKREDASLASKNRRITACLRQPVGGSRLAPNRSHGSSGYHASGSLRSGSRGGGRRPRRGRSRGGGRSRRGRRCGWSRRRGRTRFRRGLRSDLTDHNVRIDADSARSQDRSDQPCERPHRILESFGPGRFRIPRATPGAP